MTFSDSSRCWLRTRALVCRRTSSGSRAERRSNSGGEAQALSARARARLRLGRMGSRRSRYTTPWARAAGNRLRFTCSTSQVARWRESPTSWEQGRRGPGTVCKGSRTLTTRANGQPAVAVCHAAGESRWEPFAIHVLDVAGGQIERITHFMGAGVFAEFGLLEQLSEDPQEMMKL